MVPREVGVEYQMEAGRTWVETLAGCLPADGGAEELWTPQEFAWVCGVQSLPLVKAVSC